MNNPHRRKRLDQVEDLLRLAHDADSVAEAVIELVGILQDDMDGVILLRLVRDASRLLNRDTLELSWGSDVKDWNRAAEPFVKS